MELIPTLLRLFQQKLLPYKVGNKKGTLCDYFFICQEIHSCWIMQFRQTPNNYYLFKLQQFLEILPDISIILCHALYRHI